MAEKSKKDSLKKAPSKKPAAKKRSPAARASSPTRKAAGSNASPQSGVGGHSPKEPPTTGAPRSSGKVVLLSGGNPQIAKADGDAPVRAYITAMPGWKRDIGRRLDQLVEEIVPGVRKAVRWNTPFYGLEAKGWFLSFHCFDRYVKVTFFKGGLMNPPPPEKSKYPDVRYFHIHECEPIDEPQMTAWIRQAAALPGERLFS